MSTQYKATTIFILIFSLLLSGCGSGQLFGPTITPSPTITTTPTITPTSTPTLTPTLTPTSTFTPTATPIPIKLIRVERATIFRLKGFSLGTFKFPPTARVGSDPDKDLVLIQIETDEEIVLSSCKWVNKRCDPANQTIGSLVLVDEAGNKYFDLGMFNEKGEYIFEVPKTAKNLILVFKNVVRIPLP